MALEVIGIPRCFKASIRGKEIVLDDPNPSLTPERVKILYADTYAELSSASIIGPSVTADSVLYEFQGKVGVKG